MKNKQAAYDWLVKVLIIGDSGVGKTNVLLRFCQNTFNPSHLATIGIDFKIKTLEVQGKKIRIQIWDTAGQQRFKTITQTYYKGAVGIVLAYSVTDRNSFVNIQSWMKQINTHASQNVVKLIIGNKADSSQRAVTYQEGKALATKFGVSFFQTSAKQDKNILQSFVSLTKQIKDKVLTNSKRQQSSGGHKIKDKDKQDKESKKGCKC